MEWSNYATGAQSRYFENVIAELMDNPCSFRKFLENLGLENKDYEDLYNARGMYLTDIANLLEQQDITSEEY